MANKVAGRTIVRDLVGRHPQTRKVFERHGIDYCCGGGKCLADAARESGGDLDSLVSAIEAALTETPSQTNPAEWDWFAAPLADLARHILDTHHVYMKNTMPRIRDLLAKVVRAHGPRHGEMLGQVRDLFAGLDTEISGHLMKEEQVLFPFIIALDAHVHQGQPCPEACFQSVQGPIRQMEHEHENAGATLDRMRVVTDNYKLPADACPTFAALYEALHGLEADLHQHIHLENNILFPRTIELETMANR
ncbi:MAG: Iron-sulfur cluster repair protein YtfE [Phycisphaerae bacterium]|nr:Iron-sulfur cluster repair protein YtfE [Phycisphaerae bacterium]